jgi:hypothetical protein
MPNELDCPWSVRFLDLKSNLTVEAWEVLVLALKTLLAAF